MPSFGTRSESNLETCHNDLITLFYEVVKEFDCSIICGHRNQEEQEKVFAEGRSNARWGESKHNSTPSMAVDVAPYPINWANTDRFRLFAGYVLGIASQMYQVGAMDHKVRWGGDWSMDFDMEDQKFNDLPHFELVPNDE